VNRARLWIARHPENAAYLLIVVMVAGLLAIAIVKGGW